MSSDTSQGGMPQQQGSGPYRPTTWPLGGIPEVKVDVPITAVFLVLFIVGAVAHMTIFQMNKKRGHKFLFSGMLFGFCMARITTTIMRIASTCLPQNLRLAIAAQIFVAAGVLLIFIANLIFTQRVIRAQHPRWGWHPAFSIFFKANYALIGITLVMTITTVVQSFYTLNPNTKRIDRNIQLYAQSYLLFVSFLPIPLLLTSLALPRKAQVDKFGTGRFRTKFIILFVSSVLVCFGAAYRAGTSYRNPVPRSQPFPSYYHKAAFYIVNFGVEIVVVYLYVILRIDLRFHVPDGARGAGSYKAGAAAAAAEAAKDGKHVEQADAGESGSFGRVFTEEETFDNETALDEKKSRDEETGDVKSGSHS